MRASSFFQYPLVILLLFSGALAAQSGETFGWWGGADWVQSRSLAAVPPGATGQLENLYIYQRLGASGGAWARFPLGASLGVRSMAGLIFQSNGILFNWIDQPDHREDLSGLSVYLPLLLEYQNRGLPLQPFVFAGPAYSYSLRVGNSAERQVYFRRQELAINFGLGFCFVRGRYQLRPECSFNLGVNNLLWGAQELRYLQELGQRFRRDLVSLRLLVSPH